MEVDVITGIGEGGENAERDDRVDLTTEPKHLTGGYGTV